MTSSQVIPPPAVIDLTEYLRSFEAPYGTTPEVFSRVFTDWGVPEGFFPPESIISSTIPHTPVTEELFKDYKALFKLVSSFETPRPLACIGFTANGEKIIYYSYTLADKFVSEIRKTFGSYYAIKPSVYSVDCAWSKLYPEMVFGIHQTGRTSQATLLLQDDKGCTIPTTGSGPYHGYPMFGRVRVDDNGIRPVTCANELVKLVTDILATCSPKSAQSTTVPMYEF